MVVYFSNLWLWMFLYLIMAKYISIIWRNNDPPSYNGVVFLYRTMDWCFSILWWRSVFLTLTMEYFSSFFLGWSYALKNKILRDITVAMRSGVQLDYETEELHVVFFLPSYWVKYLRLCCRKFFVNKYVHVIYFLQELL